jgi:ABC-type nitrate/sulfonate/bicarbonate transport system substrate-binding protein
MFKASAGKTGIFKKHGIDARMKVVDTGTDMVNAMHNGEAQIGDMSVTTFLKAVHSGEPFKVIGIIMNDATRDNADEPLAIVMRKGTGINAGEVADPKGKQRDKRDKVIPADVRFAPFATEFATAGGNRE